jgi:C4-dicarboxylate transporter, DctQ subunit
MAVRSGPGWLARLDRAVDFTARVCDELSALVCAVLIVVTTAAMIVYQLGIAIAWLDDLLRVLLIWLVYLGTVSLCLHNDHITMDAVYLHLPAGMKRLVDVLVAILGVALCAFIAKFGYDSMRDALEFGMTLPSGYIPSWPRDLILPLCFALMAGAYARHLIAVIRGRPVRAPSEAERAAEL